MTQHWMHPVAGIVWGRGEWWPVAIAVGLAIAALTLWNYYSHSLLRTGWAKLAVAMKLAGVALLCLCLLEPMRSFRWPRPQENVVALLADDSASMKIGLRAGEWEGISQNVLHGDAAWQRDLAVDFDIRRFTFGANLQAVEEFSGLTTAQRESNLAAALESLERQMQRRAVAAAFIVTDGNATDAAALEAKLAALQPGPDAADRDAREGESNAEKIGGPYPFAVFPVIVHPERILADLRVAQTTVQVADFESAPATIGVRLAASELRGREVTVRALDDAGKVAAEKQVKLPTDRDEMLVTLELADVASGLHVYRVAALLSDEAGAVGEDGRPAELQRESDEATLENNSRLAMVDRGQGPYRVLYVAGRPNWEFKFLRRAVAADREIDLVGLIRIARREAKFAFRDKAVESTNPLFAGFEDDPDGAAEQYDEAVYTRLGVRDASELKGGFPKAAEELFGFHAVVIDDLEAAALTLPQQQLLRRFVSERGGLLLLLGGAEAFRGRAFRDSPLAAMMPFYFGGDDTESVRETRFELTREGWLQPAMRLAATEPEERQRLQSMPSFRSAVAASGVKPGAVVYARGERDDQAAPILATQRFGSGRAAALLLSDFWRWAMRYDSAEDSADQSVFFRSRTDRDQNANPAFVAWRQIMRWLLTDVAKRVEVSVEASEAVADAPAELRTVRVVVRDEEYRPDDAAQVEVQLTPPGGGSVPVTARASDDEPGVYLAEVYGDADGAYRITATAKDADGKELGSEQAGFTIDRLSSEYACLERNDRLLRSLAERTGGRVLEAGELQSAVRDLTELDSIQTVRRVEPLWHQPWLLAAALGLIAGEWGLRRWRGLP